MFVLLATVSSTFSKFRTTCKHVSLEKVLETAARSPKTENIMEGHWRQVLTSASPRPLSHVFSLVFSSLSWGWFIFSRLFCLCLWSVPFSSSRLWLQVHISKHSRSLPCWRDIHKPCRNVGLLGPCSKTGRKRPYCQKQRSQSEQQTKNCGINYTAFERIPFVLPLMHDGRH